MILSDPQRAGILILYLGGLLFMFWIIEVQIFNGTNSSSTKLCFCDKFLGDKIIHAFVWELPLKWRLDLMATNLFLLIIFAMVFLID